MDHSDKGDRQQSESRVKASDDSAAEAERLKKINDLAKALADGTYHVSAEEVAGKVIEHLLEPKG
jgi:anti-sigma28 factor (negative regulator of flagellin synthesis)